MKAYWFATVSCILVGLSSAIQVKDCGSKLGSFSEVSITSCPVADPVCVLRRDTNVTIDIVFKTNVDVPALKASVHGIVGGLPVPYPLKNPDACAESGLTCPLKAGASQRYTGTFQVMHQYPRIHVKVRWEMKTASGDDVLCLEIPTEIKSGPPPPTVILI